MRGKLAARMRRGSCREAADLVTRNVSLFELVAGDLLPTGIAICGERVLGILDTYEGVSEIDMHFHVEPSLNHAVRV